MSNRDDDLMWLDEQEAAERAQSRGVPTVIYVLLGMGIFFFISCLGMGFLAWRMVERDFGWLAEEFEEIELPDPVVEGAEEKRTNVITAFNGDDPPPEDEQTEAIVKQFDRLSETIGNADHEAFRKLFDLDRMTQRILETGRTGPVTVAGKRQLRQMLSSYMYLPLDEAEYRIVRVQDLGEDERLVYVVHYDYQDFEELRWWLTRDADGWKFYNWEDLRLGMPEAEQWAVFHQFMDEEQMGNWYEMSQLTDQALSTYYEDEDKAAVLIREAERLAFHPTIAPLCWLDIAQTWDDIDRHEEALAAYDRVADPNRHPGVWLGRARIARDDERWDDALTAIREFEKQIGRSPNVLWIEAQAMQQQENYEQAIAHAAAGASWFPDAWQFRNLLGDLLTDDEAMLADVFTARITSVLATADLPPAQLESIADRLMYSRNREALAAMANVLRERSVEPSLLASVDSRKAQAGADYSMAIDAARRSWEQTDDEELRQSRKFHLLDLMLSVGHAAEYYALQPDCEAALHDIMGYYIDEGELYTVYDWMEPLLRQHEQGCGASAYSRFCQGLLAQGRGELEAAAQYFAQARSIMNQDEIKDTTADPDTDEDPDEEYDELPYFLDYAQSEVLRELGHYMEVYELAEEKSYAFVELVERPAVRNNPAQIAALIERHATEFPDGHEVAFAKDLLAFDQQDYESVMQHMRERLQAKPVAEGWDPETQRYRTLLFRAVWRSAGFESALNEFESDHAVLATVLHLVSDELNAHEAELAVDHLPDGLETAPLKISLLEQAERWEKIVSLSETLMTDAATTDDYAIRDVQRSLFNADIRLARIDEARRLATNEDEGKYQYETSRRAAVLAVIDGDAAGLLHMADSKDRTLIGIRQIYSDAVTAGLMMNDAFADFRKRFPPDPSIMFDSGAVGITAESPTVDEATISQWCTDAGFPEAEITVVASPESNGATYLVVAGLAAVIISQGNDNYETYEPLEAESESIRKLLQPGAGWVSLTFMGLPDSEQRIASREVAAKLTAEFLKSPETGLYFASTGRLCEPSEPLTARLREGRYPSDWESRDLGRPLNSYLNTTFLTTTSDLYTDAYMGMLSRRAPDASEGSAAQVLVEAGGAVMWLDIVDAVSDDDRDQEIRRVRPAEDDPLGKLFPAGMEFEVNDYQIEDWRIGTPENWTTPTDVYRADFAEPAAETASR